MARRKKRKKRSDEQKSGKKKQGAFNPLKGELASLKKAGKLEAKKQLVKTIPERKIVEDEDQLFLNALSDVNLLSGTKKKIAQLPDSNIKPVHSAGNDELEGLAYLSDLVSGQAEMDISFTDEYIEGAIAGISRKLMQQLKKGRVPIQDYVDLHGMTRGEAEESVRDFLLESYRRGLRCVLVVHGRGLNSENKIPVLKELLPVWLNRGPINKIVLAFSTAKPYDGGLGAVYVLLRRSKSPKPSGFINGEL